MTSQTNTKTESRLQSAKKLFGEIDVNGDGTISRDELFSALSTNKSLHMPTSKSTFEYLFNKIDTDRSNSICEKEFEKFVLNRFQELEDAFENLLKKASSSSSVELVTNRSLTSSDFRQAAAQSGVILSNDDLRRIMSQLDKNGDQRVSFDEFVDALMLSPQINPKAFLDSWWTDIFVDDAQSDYTTPREIRVTEHPYHRQGQGQAEGKGQYKKSKTSDGDTKQSEEDDGNNLPPTFGQMVLKKLVCGGASGVLSRTLTAPVDRVRLLMMTSDKRLSVAQALKQIDSFKGFFRGNFTNCVKVTPEMAIKLLAFDLLKQNLSQDPGNITIFERLIAGAGAGFCSQVTIYPLEVIRTRMATSQKPFKSIGHCAQTVLKDSGVKGFYSGLVPSAVGILPYAALDLSLNSFFKEIAAERLQQQNREVSIPLLLGCGMLSSSIATICTFPLNVIRTKAQASGASVAEILKDIMNRPEQGGGGGSGVAGGGAVPPKSSTIFKRFFVGLLPCLSKSVPATAISYSAYEFLGKRWTY